VDGVWRTVYVGSDCYYQYELQTVNQAPGGGGNGGGAGGGAAAAGGSTSRSSDRR